MENRPNPERRVSEDDVRRILTRAADLDIARAGSLTPTEIIAVAEEAGISEESVRRAIGEVLKEAPGDRSREASVPATSWWKRRLEIGLAGATLGAIAAIFSTPSSPAVDYGAIVGMAGLVILSVRCSVRSRSQVAFQGANVALWVGFIAALVMLADYPVIDDAARPLMLYWSVSAALGGLVNFFAARTAHGRGERAAPTGELNTA